VLNILEEVFAWAVILISRSAPGVATAVVYSAPIRMRHREYPALVDGTSSSEQNWQLAFLAQIILIDPSPLTLRSSVINTHDPAQ
jgi:hypothetical protein